MKRLFLFFVLVFALATCSDRPDHPSSTPIGPEVVSPPSAPSFVDKLGELTANDFTLFTSEQADVARVQRMIEARQRSRGLVKAQNDPEEIAVVTDDPPCVDCDFDVNERMRCVMDTIEKDLAKTRRSVRMEFFVDLDAALDSDAETIVVEVKNNIMQATEVQVGEKRRIVGCSCGEEGCQIRAALGVDPWFALGAGAELDMWNVVFDGQGSDAQAALFASGATFFGHNVGFQNFDSGIPTFPVLGFSSQATFENATFFGNTGADVVTVNGFLQVSGTVFKNGLNALEVFGPASQVEAWDNSFEHYDFPLVFVDAGETRIEGSSFQDFEVGHLYFDATGAAFWGGNVYRDGLIGTVYLSDLPYAYHAFNNSFERVSDAALGSVGGSGHIVDGNNVEGGGVFGAGFFIEDTSMPLIKGNNTDGVSPVLAFNDGVSDAVVTGNTADAGPGTACVDPSPPNGNPLSRTSNQWCTNTVDGTSEPAFLCDQPNVEGGDEIVITPAGIQVAVFKVKGSNATSEQLAPSISSETSAVFVKFDTIPVGASPPSGAVECAVPVAIVVPTSGPYVDQKIAILNTAMTVIPN